MMVAVVGLLVSGTAVAADNETVLLHCNGYIENIHGKRHGFSENVLIDVNGGVNLAP